MTDPLLVEADFHGALIRPRALHWRGKTYRYLELGRHWQEEGEVHWLVRTLNGQVFELIYQPEEGRWYMGRTPQEFQLRRPFV